MTKSAAQLFVVSWLMSAFLASQLTAQHVELVYQARGSGGSGFSEGIRSTPSTGLSLVLIGALVDYQEPAGALPAQFHARFYLPDAQVPYLTIREIKSRYNYWLGDLKQSWKPQIANEFVWSTDKVVRRLNWDGGALRLTELGATVRLGSPELGKMQENVAPVALYSSRAPQTVEGYQFVFLPNQGMRLRFEVLPDQGNQVLEASQPLAVLADTPQTFAWKVGNRPEGWYRLKVTGYASSDNSGNKPIARTVRFYHSLRLTCPEASGHC